MTTVIEHKHMEAAGMTPAEKRKWRLSQLQAIQAKKHKPKKGGRRGY